MRILLTIQGWFYVLTGIWPVLHIKSFEMITGPKIDKWLVKTVGLMITCSGVIFIVFNDTMAALTLAMLNALTLGIVDIFYVTKKIIPKIYLVDALIEFVFIAVYTYYWN